MSKPTIHVTNWSSRKLHGPGRKFTIMANPRHWERGEGFVGALAPLPGWLEAIQGGRISLKRYRYLCVDKFEQEPIVPGDLMVMTDTDRVPVEDGDTLCCACSKAAAARGECHRVWAAELLANAGWRVILDGQEIEA